MKKLEVYINNVIGVEQIQDLEELLLLSHGIVHAVHSLFPPPQQMGHLSKESCSLKKLKQGDELWHHQKEILGCVFNGITRCMEVPSQMCNMILEEMKMVLQRQQIPHKCFE